MSNSITDDDIVNSLCIRYNVKFSGCQIFQQRYPFQIIRNLYGDCKVLFVRLPSTTLMVDEVYREYTSIVMKPFFKIGRPWLPPPLLEIVDGLKNEWKTEVARLILSSTKPVLVVLESVVFPGNYRIHKKRVQQIMGIVFQLAA